MKGVIIATLYSALTTIVILGVAKCGSLAAFPAPFYSTTLGNNQNALSNLIAWLNYSFQKNTVAWLLISSLISSLIGGIIGASSKFIFEVILPFQFKEKKEVVVIARKYSVPILVSAEALRNRLDNMIRLHKTIEDNGWLSHTEGYYYLSTLFLMGRFLGWLEILRSTVVWLDLSSVQQTRTFEKYLSSIESVLSDPQLFLDLSDTSSLKGGDRDWCYSYELSAIGEVMSFRDSSNNEYRVYGFAAFKKLILANDPEKLEFRNWFDCLSKLFQDLKYNEPRFKRLVAAHAVLTSFINYMDPKHIRTRKRNCYWEHLSADQKAKVESQIELIKK